jgi:hypothetical protein
MLFHSLGETSRFNIFLREIHNSVFQLPIMLDVSSA